MSTIAKHLKHLSKNSFVYSAGNVLSKALIILLMPLYTRLFDASGYGAVETIRVLVSALTIFYFFGLDGAIGRFYFDFSESDQRREYLGTIFFAILAIAGTLSVVLSLSGEAIFDYLTPGIPIRYVYYGIWYTFLSVPLAYLMVVLQAEQKAFHYVVFQLLQIVSLLSIYLIFIVVFKKGVEGKLLGDLASGGVLFAGVFVYIIRRDLIKFRFNTKEFVSSLKLGFPVVPHLLSAWIFNLGSRFVLQRYVPLSDVGVYSVGQNIGMIMFILVASFNSAWAPFMFDQAKKNPDAEQIFSRLTTYYAVVIFGVSIVLMTACQWIVAIMAGSIYREAVPVSIVMVFSYSVYGFYFMFTNQIWYSKRTGMLPLITGTTAVGSIIFNLIAVPKYGIMGATYAFLVSCILFVALTYFVSRRVYPIAYNLPALFRCFFIAMACGIIILVSPLEPGVLDVAAKMGLVILYCLLVWHGGIFSLQERKRVEENLSSFIGKLNRKMTMRKVT